MADPTEREQKTPLSQGEPKRARKDLLNLVSKPSKLGGTGNPVTLRANYFVLTRLPAESPRLYEVQIIPGKPVFETIDGKREHKVDENGNREWVRGGASVIPPSRATNRKIIARLVELYKDRDFGGKLPGYDGAKLLYARERLAFEAAGDAAKEFLVDLPAENNEGIEVREKRFYVTLTRPADAESDINLEVLRLALAGRVRNVPSNAVSALETVMKQRMSEIYRVVGQSFFDPAKRAVDLGGGIECWTGFYQSLRPIQLSAAADGQPQVGALALNIDTAVTAFVKPQSVIEFVAAVLRTSLQQLRNRPPLNPSEINKVKKALKGLTIETLHRKKKLRAGKISTRPVREILFPMRDTKDREGEDAAAATPRMVSVPQYFKERYKREIQYGNLPAFMTGERSQTATPFELCVISKGNRQRKLADFQTAAMIKKAAQPPAQRRRETEEIVRINQYNEDPLVQEWGLGVSPEMLRVSARVLQAPELLYGHGDTVKPQFPGKWNLVNRGRPSKMFRSEPIKSWGLLNLDPVVGRNQADGIARRLVQEANTFGLQLPDLQADAMENGNTDNIEPSIRKLAARAPQFVLVILPPGKVPLYPVLKRLCEVKHEANDKGENVLGFPTQCCSADKVIKELDKGQRGQQYFANLVQKINAKTGGQNVSFAENILNRQPKLRDGGTVFMGADVSHAPSHRSDVPSVAAVVGSLNVPVPTMYQAEVSTQRPRQEIIDTLFTPGAVDPETKKILRRPGGAIRALLNGFYLSAHLKPKRIVFYRDGVSDGQFQSVLEEEVVAIKKACQSIERGYNPLLTFIIVQKRHKTRFYPDRQSDGDPKGNIRAGTVVDRDVTHPSLFDFFLCSHEGIQGTSRPVHYYVVYDENNFSADEIQGLTNDLTYTYAACTRSISVAPPAYYADLAATRARLYMQDDFDSDSASVSSGEGGANAAWQNYRMPVVQDALKNRMVFC